jgi:GTPase SAR1 family protein
MVGTARAVHSPYWLDAASRKNRRPEHWEYDDSRRNKSDTFQADLQHWQTTFPQYPLFGYKRMAFHPNISQLATLYTDLGSEVVRSLDVDLKQLLASSTTSSSIHHITAKIVLVGNSGVGKTGLGWRLANGEFREQSSTHGQQFWILDRLSVKRDDGAECEAVLWDLAGQPDYRLIHGLFLDDAELALVVFDAANRDEPLLGVEFWLKALSIGRNPPCPVILIAARSDRGAPNITDEEIKQYCRSRSISGGYVLTSALTGYGLDTLIEKINDQIPWNTIPATVTTQVFRQIREFILSVKEEVTINVLKSREEIRTELEHRHPILRFDDDELETSVRNLAKYGYVRPLRTASGEETILVRPELLNNLAASLILEARRNARGLGALEENRLRTGDYVLPELAGIRPEERETLIDSAIVLFIERNLCFREYHGAATFLIFPQLINRKRPLAISDEKMIEDVSYNIKGAVENVYAALVVLLGYTSVFVRTDQWQNHARYELGEGEVCGFQQVSERDGELELVLQYGLDTSQSTRFLFQSLFERFLITRRVAVSRFPSIICDHCKYRQERAEVIRRTTDGIGFLFCSNCGNKLDIAVSGESIAQPGRRASLIEHQQATAFARTRFEAAIVRLRSYLLIEGKLETPPTCFVSYAWGQPQSELWVERSLSTDLRNAGIEVLLDRWENASIGSNIARFVEHITRCKNIIVVGTPGYLEKYTNPNTDRGHVLAAEIDLINHRMLGSEAEKRSILPILYEGEPKAALPSFLRGRVAGDFRRDNEYFTTLFDLILSIFEISFKNQAVIDLRTELRASTLANVATSKKPSRRARGG